MPGPFASTYSIHRRVLPGIWLALVLIGCSSGRGATPAASASRGSGIRGQDPPTSSPSAGSAGQHTGTPSTAGSPSPTPISSSTSIPVTASVTPACAAVGNVVTVQVRTLPKAAVAYVAEYSDGKSGAAYPWGAGYGGNAGGRAGTDGVYTSSWTLAPNAPAGQAKVDVIVDGSQGQGDATAIFAVADHSGRCSGSTAAASMSWTPSWNETRHEAYRS